MTICVLAWIIDYSQTTECSKSHTCFENVTETWNRDMYENAKMWIVMKMVWGIVKNERPQTVLILEKKKKC